MAGVKKLEGSLNDAGTAVSHILLDSNNPNNKQALPQFTYDVNGNVTGLLNPVNNATLALGGGGSPSTPKTAITSSRATTSADDNALLENSTTTSYTITIASGTVPNGLIFQQLNTGLITVTAGSGVTFIGSVLSTSGAGQTISVIPTTTANTFNIKVG